MKGLIFNIKRYSIHDGPGIRISVFMKGCPLSCWWCHNPEGILPYQEEADQVNRVGEKEFRQREKVGKYYTPAEIIDIAEKERIFIENSGGGVTFTGGEPLMQPEFLEGALAACRQNGFHTAVDTSGYVQRSALQKILTHTSLFLFDIKHMDAEKHLEYTGVTNEIILDNLYFLAASGKEIMIRIPVVPGINDDPLNLDRILLMLQRIKGENIRMVNLLPYHRIGSAKYRKFGIPNRMEGFSIPSPDRMKELKTFFSQSGIKVKIGG